MRNLREILRLRLVAQLSLRQIARSCRVSLGAVQRIVSRADAADIDETRLGSLSDAQLNSPIYPPPEPDAGALQFPDCAYMHQELKRKGVTKQLLWDEYVLQFGDRAYRYSQFCEHYRRWLKHQKRSMRQIHRAGEKCFIDYCGHTVPIINGDTGECREAQSTAPTTHSASGPNDVWMWDITYLPSRTIGKHYYLYMIEDLYSRYGVHWEVHESESGELASKLISQAVLKSCKQGERPVLHSDNGSPMKSFTMRAKMDALGVKPSYSRPRVSNDNAYIESMFRTVKYCPQWPSQGFESIEVARKWVAPFMRWYNDEHCHSALRFVTPGQRYRGEDVKLLKKREAVYQVAKGCNPNRWSGRTRNWKPVGDVALNPEKEVTLAA